MDATVVLLGVTVVAALGFAYTNGFHDASNAIATSVSTRALTPSVALVLAAVMNFVGALLSTGVAATVGFGLLEPPAGHDGVAVVLAALLAAAAWNLVTWWYGLPSSSTHALVSGLVGAGLAAATQVHWEVVNDQVLIPLVLSPAVGLVAAYLLMTGLMWLCRKASYAAATRRFRLAQTVSASAMAMGHGLQDGQKTMGAIVLAMVAAGTLTEQTIPLWVQLASAAALALGTAAGGWRIVRTLGRRVIDLDPARGFAAEVSGTAVLYVASLLGAPISTTQTVTAALVGTGATRRWSAVRWRVIRDIVLAWVLTIPVTGLVAAGLFLVLAPMLG